MKVLCAWVLAGVVAAGCGRLGFSENSAADASVDPDAVAIDANIPATEFRFGEVDGALGGTFVDTTIKNYDPDSNFVSTGWVGAWAPLDGEDTEPGLMRIELSSLAGQTVLSAKLDFAVNQDVDEVFEGETIVLFELLEEWDPSETSYNNRLVGVPWSSPGANGAARGSMLGMKTTEADEQRVTVSLSSSVIERWASESDENHGFIVLVDADDHSGSWLASSDYSEVARRPVLRVLVAD